MTTSAIAFLLALAVSLLATLIVRVAARRWGILDRPDNYRKVHSKAVPRLGGVAIFIGFLCPIGALYFVYRNVVSDMLYTHPLLLGGLLGGGAIALATGIIDDVRNLSPHWKIILQTAAALVALLAGYSISRVNNPFGQPWVLGWLTVPVTLFWFLGCMNAVNLLDGLDGLAAGVCLVASVTLFLVSVLFGNVLSMLLLASLSGAIFGFLLFNFHPASIFLGDSGTMLLGFMIGALSLSGARKAEATVVLLIPAVALGLPILDTSVAILRRWSRKLPISSADRHHIHHFLLSTGLSHKRVVLILYVVCLSLGAVALLIATGRDEVTLFIIGSLGIIAFVCIRVFGQLRLNDIWGRLIGQLKEKHRSAEAKVSVQKTIARMKNAKTTEGVWEVFSRGLEDLEFDFAKFHLFKRNGVRVRSLTWSNNGNWAGGQDPIESDFWSARLRVKNNGHLFGELELGKRIKQSPLLAEAPELVDLLRKEMAAQLERMQDADAAGAARSRSNAA